MKVLLKKIMLSMCLLICLLSFSSAYGQFAPFATFELGEGTIESYTTTATQTTPFTTIMFDGEFETCLLYTSPSPRDQRGSRMPSSA